ncbi:biotin/lipoyl-binding protein [Pseudoflavonifractor sp. MSJ-30]|uniref:biotin/lipoyl-binding protein n=1 Tax=Pseudoflavonifractor sp. MSJ-30 TaxID=2841525 RepID=UPI001C0F7452|nr:biotin/lipoyl-binding protein [Pseudoflavonifractor sp. MSJ-30]MBU5453380.1 biotin/lipoyl-binding protein [Pseudoflavonifractor sp. MSJ-30]
MKLKLPKKAIVIGASVLAVAGIGAGIFAAAAKGGSKPVYVYNFDICGMTDYWGDRQSTSGLVRADNIQTVMLSDTQTITGVEVKQGDKVKKGDLLLSFDTTLTDLALEKKRLAVEQLKLQLQDEQDKLQQIRNYTPYTPRQDDGGTGGSGQGELFGYEHYPDYGSRGDVAVEEWLNTYGADGSSTDSPLILWTKTNTVMDTDLAAEMASFLQRCRYTQALNAYDEAYAAYQQAYAAWEADTSDDKGEAPAEPKKPAPEDYAVSDYYMILKSTAGNMTLGSNAVFQGMHVYFSGGSFLFVPFDASGCYDYTRPAEPEPDPDPEPDPGPTYTLEEIVRMKEEQQKKILDVEYQIKIAEAEYNIAKKEADDGNVYAEVDGTVVSVLTEEEARANQTPIIKVSGGGGYYVTGTVSELERDKLELGSEVTITDWRNGTSCTGTVQSIGDFPSTATYYSSNNNPNASFYPFTVLVDEDADLVPGYYVDMEYSLSDSTDGIYLSNPFLRTEQGASFVYVQGENGKLERRDVVTGKSVWGSYTQILSGITMDDLIAFPYGKNVKPGVPTEQGDYSTLYDSN